MSSNFAEFDRRLKARADAVPGLITRRHQRIAQYAMDTAEAESPVATGDFKRAWETVTDGGIGGLLDEERTGDAATYMERVPRLEPFSVTSLINRDPAARRIESGWSDKAPAGVLGTTIQRVRAAIRRGL